MGVATPLVKVDSVPLGRDPHSWVLTSEGTTIHNGEVITRLKEKPAEGDILVSEWVGPLIAAETPKTVSGFVEIQTWIQLLKARQNNLLVSVSLAYELGLNTEFREVISRNATERVIDAFWGLEMMMWPLCPTGYVTYCGKWQWMSYDRCCVHRGWAMTMWSWTSFSTGSRSSVPFWALKEPSFLCSMVSVCSHSLSVSVLISLLAPPSLHSPPSLSLPPLLTYNILPPFSGWWSHFGRPIPWLCLPAPWWVRQNYVREEHTMTVSYQTHRPSLDLTQLVHLQHWSTITACMYMCIIICYMYIFSGVWSINHIFNVVCHYNYLYSGISDKMFYLLWTWWPHPVLSWLPMVTMRMT